MINNDKFLSYSEAINVIKTLISKGYLNEEKYVVLEKKIAKKYKLKNNSIYRKYSLDIKSK